VVGGSAPLRAALKVSVGILFKKSSNFDQKVPPVRIFKRLEVASFRSGSAKTTILYGFLKLRKQFLPVFSFFAPFICAAKRPVGATLSNEEVSICGEIISFARTFFEGR
jgi:hypothetical protein